MRHDPIARGSFERIQFGPVHIDGLANVEIHESNMGGANTNISEIFGLLAVAVAQFE